MTVTPLLLLAPTPLLARIGVHDLRHRRIPNPQVAVLAAAVAATVALIGAVEHRPIAVPACVGAVLAGAPLAVPWLVQPAAVGGGDIKLAIVTGALVSVVHPYASLIVTAAALVVTIVAMRARRQRSAPLGPALVAAAVAVIAVAAPLLAMRG